MNTQNENLKKLLLFIEELVKDENNEWFRLELINKLTSQYLNSTTDLGSEIIEIRNALQIKGRISIDYNYIKEDRLRQQLVVDNLRMENAALELKELNEIERFYNFCINAFFQVENLLNYFYHKKYSSIESLLDHFEKLPTSKFRRNGKERNVSDIIISTKIYAFTTEFQSDLNFNPYKLSNLSKVRNEGLHRCTVIFNEEKENQLYSFFKYEDYTTIRSMLISLSRLIEFYLKYE